MRTKDDLRILQALPLDIKIMMTVRRLSDWISFYGIDGVYLSWSGGKDSTVLRHIIMQHWPNVVSVFVNTGLEFPEIQQFVKAAKKRGENVEILRPAMRFDEVIKKYGYPIISKEVSQTVYEARRSLARGRTDTVKIKKINGDIDNKTGTGKSRYDHSKYKPLLDIDFFVSDRCCNVMKKGPAKEYAKKTGRKAILATMAAESKLRETSWMRFGCNGFDMAEPTCRPMSFWTEQDVLEYIKTYNVELPSVYGDVIYASEPEQVRLEEIIDQDIGCDTLRTTGCDRTGCIFCGFGAHLEKGEGRFERLKKTHPRQYEYCIGGGEFNEDGIWQPNKKGLGMGHVFDELNRLYGDGFIKY